MILRLLHRLPPRERFMTVALVIAVTITAATMAWERFTAEWLAEDADPQRAAQVRLGEAVYGRACVACHGQRLEGQAGWEEVLPEGGRKAVPLDRTGFAWRKSDVELAQIVKYGGQPFSPAGYRNDMPGFDGQLSDAEIWAVIAFIKSKWPQPFRDRQKEISEGRTQ
jgi:mono/diheme cytochrome c family protein